jgi:hypothetical protein
MPIRMPFILTICKTDYYDRLHKNIQESDVQNGTELCPLSVIKKVQEKILPEPKGQKLKIKRTNTQ